MKEFFIKYKTIILSVAGAAVAAALAILLAIVLTKETKMAFSNSAYMSHINGVSSSNSESVVSDGPVESEPQEIVAPLNITSPAQKDSTVSESFFAISGTSDPKKPLVLNGKEVTRLESGEFSIEVELKPGKNNFVFEYNGTSVTYVIRYTFTVIKAYAPYEKQKYEAGSSFVVVASARVDSSSVTATFNGKKINLVAQPCKDGEEFTNFTGTFTLPTGNETDVNLGGVKFTGTCNGLTRSYTSPAIICLRDKSLDGTQVVEIVTTQAETFNGDTTDDWSRPTNSYLPKGTVDYKVGGIVYDAKSGNSYYNLRCGKRVYITKKNSPDPDRITVSKLYKGDLPEQNSVSLSSNEISGRHTQFVFDVAWRAPFSVDVAPQGYTNPSKQEYTVTGVTYKYVDIKFFYTPQLQGDFAFENHPLFESAQILSGTNGCVLRLHPKDTGAFYGWNAEYNSSGQLVFKFLNPPTVTKKNDLTGIKIVIDAGHGGKDIGAPGLRPKTNYEAERNLSLAYKLKAQLESYGATVVMTRTGNTSLSADARCDFLRREAPDFCISVHHDSSTRASANGGGIFCFNAFSDRATKCIYDRTKAAGFYRNIQKSWHYFFLARVTSCPVVLTENGFISNQQDFEGIISDSVNTQKAKAITEGVLDYFNSFYKIVANDPDNGYNGDNSGPNGQEPNDPPEQQPDQPQQPELPSTSEPEEPSIEDPILPPEQKPEQEENDTIGDENENE